MPPDGYHTVTISDELAQKLGRVMAEYEIDSYAAPIEHAVDSVLAQEQALTPL
jgi:hypothetical protein